MGLIYKLQDNIYDSVVYITWVLYFVIFFILVPIILAIIVILSSYLTMLDKKKYRLNTNYFLL